ncbi:MAG TPA: hypothetical protein VM434_12960 [Beijerinckiaceae bacterium]|nr:hypothetical protein [Beijerinckiaceae bacterium]
MTWLPSRSGRPIELLAPRVDEVDFAELAHALAHLNRSSGNPPVPVSVGLHTLVGCDLAPEALRPWWLLHDAHEARTGEVTSPAKEALAAIARELAGERGAGFLAEVRHEFEARHDAAIHAAAGLPLPTDAQKSALKRIDLAALATERRDFYGPQQRAWCIDAAGIAPGKRVWRWRAPDKVADELLALFRAYLPALAGAALAGRAALAAARP